jgi:hypothetical protein
MTPVFMMMWAALAATTGSVDIQHVACLQDGTVVGNDGRFALRRWRDGAWGPAEGAIEARELWTSSTGQVYVRGGRTGMALLKPDMSAQEVRLPPTGTGSLTFSADSAGDLSLASTDKIFRLTADGTTSEVGEPPRVEPTLKFRPSQPPVVFSTAHGWIACFPGSPFEIDHGMKGVCVKPEPSRYEYRVDFGRYSDRTRAAPFVCGDALVSSVGDQSQARRLSDGHRVGQVRGPARMGSRCLPDGRPLLVGPLELRFFEGSELKRLRVESVRGRIRDVAMCRKQAAVLLEDSTIVLIDAPTTVGAPHPGATGRPQARSSASTHAP